MFLQRLRGIPAVPPAIPSTGTIPRVHRYVFVFYCVFFSMMDGRLMCYEPKPYQQLRVAGSRDTCRQRPTRKERTGRGCRFGTQGLSCNFAYIKPAFIPRIASHMEGLDATCLLLDSYSIKHSTHLYTYTLVDARVRLSVFRMRHRLSKNSWQVPIYYTDPGANSGIPRQETLHRSSVETYQLT